jgi:hypothetical protein
VDLVHEAVTGVTNAETVTPPGTEGEPQERTSNEEANGEALVKVEEKSSGRMDDAVKAPQTDGVTTEQTESAQEGVPAEGRVKEERGSDGENPRSQEGNGFFVRVSITYRGNVVRCI